MLSLIWRRGTTTLFMTYAFAGFAYHPRLTDTSVVLLADADWRPKEGESGWYVARSLEKRSQISPQDAPKELLEMFLRQLNDVFENHYAPGAPLQEDASLAFARLYARFHFLQQLNSIAPWQPRNLLLPGAPHTEGASSHSSLYPLDGVKKVLQGI